MFVPTAGALLVPYGLYAPGKAKRISRSGGEEREAESLLKSTVPWLNTASAGDKKQVNPNKIFPILVAPPLWLVHIKLPRILFSIID